MATDVPSQGHDCAQAAQLASLLQADDVDAALEAGLMHYSPCPACDPAAQALLQATQQRLAAAWAARARYQARAERLARRAAERDTRRLPAPTLAAQPGGPLPAAAAAILARAKARAAERGKP